MAGQLSLLPGIDVQADLLAQEIDLVLQVLELQARILVSAGARLQQRHLFFDDFQLPLRFDCWVQIMTCFDSALSGLNQLASVHTP